MENLLTKIAKNRKLLKPVIYGFSGPKLTSEEKYFFSKNGCLGFIIFSRNIENKAQLKELTKSLREVMEGEVLILIDQEGGRVARMTGNDWKPYPNGAHFASLYKQNPVQAQKEIFENFQAIASDLFEVGINVNCAPVLDIITEKTHHIIGDRAYGANSTQVTELGKKVCEGMLSKNVFPVIKHIPGHGRADCDSHLTLPIVDDELAQLRASDFIPFKELNYMKFAMTAHVLFSKIDSQSPATTSKKVIDLIRHEIGFKNILMTDDLAMKALSGSVRVRTESALKAGCDLILHCNGNMTEMTEVDASLPTIDDSFLERLIS